VKKIVQRLLIFFLGIPAVVSLIVFLPYRNHLAVNAVVIIISALGAVELARMLEKKGLSLQHAAEAAVLGALSPLSMTLSVSFQISSQITPAFFIIGASWLLASGIICHKDDFSGVISRLAAGFSVMIYPGHFLSWIIRMCLFRHSVTVLLMFILTVMVNDSIAWAAGMLFGKGNKGLFAVSPNKSIAGFAAGLLASTGLCAGAAILLPDVFDPDQIHRLPSGILLGLVSGIAVILGDLAESAIKRSCGVKDSGNLIPGRGGMLDSVDSLAFTAPAFFVLYRFFF
jgi:phosphatidate cytidylyltransferase